MREENEGLMVTGYGGGGYSASHDESKRFFFLSTFARPPTLGAVDQK